MFYVKNKHKKDPDFSFADEGEAEAVCDSLGRDEFEVISDEKTEEEEIAEEAFLETLGVH